MGLNAALVDRARLVTRVQTGDRVDGRPRRGTHYGPWFKCRLRDSRSTESMTDGSKRYRYRPNFMAARKALDHTPVKLHGSDRLEIHSKEFGNAVYELDGDVAYVRKRRGIHHIEGIVLKVEVPREHTELRDWAEGQQTSAAVHSGV